MILSYARCSSISQKLDRQQVLLDDEKYHVDKHFEEKISGKDENRPQLQAMLEFCREGDLIICTSLDRISRSLQGLLRIIEILNKKGVAIKFLKENLEFNPKSPASAMNTLSLQIFGAFAEWERQCLKFRQLEGIKIAKEKGVYKNRKRKVPEEKYAEIDRIVSDEGLSLVQACKKVGVSRAMYYIHKKQKENASKASKETQQNEKA